jgi:hypothetical protein
MYNLVESIFLPYSLWDLTSANASALRTTVNYKMIVGDADSQYQSNTRFRDHLLSLEIDPHFQVLPGVEHQGGAYLADGSGVSFLSAHFTSKFQQNGDYDRDGDMDTSDYAVWRAAYGSNSSPTADGTQNGIIDAGDYIVWRKNARLAGASSIETATVPEPATVLLNPCWLFLSRLRRKPVSYCPPRH